MNFIQCIKVKVIVYYFYLYSYKKTILIARDYENFYINYPLNEQRVSSPVQFR